MKDETRQILELIVEKTNELKTFKFDEHVKSIGLGFQGRRTDNDEWIMEFGLPDKKDRDAFILTFRLFYQKNEAISFINLGKLLDNPDLSNEWKDAIKKARKVYFDFLNGHSDYTVNIFEGRPTRGEMLDTVLYGGLAHANNPEKIQKLKMWSSDGIRANLLQQEFAAMLVQILGIIKYIGEVTEQELFRKPI